MTPNLFLLVADGKASEVQTILEQDPSKASQQDDNGYSLLHAAASYNEFDLVRKLVRDYHVDVNLPDKFGESPLFGVECIEAAKLLVEDLAANVLAKNNEGQTAAQLIEEDGDYPEVAHYLRNLETQLKELEQHNGDNNGDLPGSALKYSTSATSSTDMSPALSADSNELPPVPKGLSLSVKQIDEADLAGIEVDSAFRARIEELASREDFNTPEGQARLRHLVQDAVEGKDFAQERNTRPKY